MTAHVVLCLSSASDYRIRDQIGKIYTPAEARALWEAGRVSDYNLAFKRLVDYDFDPEAVRRSYRNHI